MYEKSFIANPSNKELVAMSKALALAFVLVFLTASSTILAIPVSGVAVAENSWVTRAPMHFARANIGVAVANGQIYAIGGDNGTEMGNVSPGTSLTINVVNVIEVYNPSSDTWVSAAPMLTARALFGTAVYQNKIYCIGGYSGAAVFIGPENWNWETKYYDIAANEVYDTVTNTWATKASIPTPRFSAATNIVNDKIYVIGGYTQANIDVANITQVYDPQADSWATKSSAPLPVTSSASAVVDNNIYVLGRNQSGSFIEIYNPANDVWSIGGKAPLAYWSTGAATNGVNAPKRIYFFNENKTDIYDPATGNWTTGTPPPTDRLLAIVAVVNEVFYLIGGRTGQWGYITMEYPSTLNEQYIPVGYGTPDPSYVLAHTPPKISLLPPENQTYNESSFSIVFSPDRDVNWAAYSLDEQQNVTLTGNYTIKGGDIINFTLSNMKNGFYNITIYANSTFGYLASETINFSVAKPESFPVVPVAAAAVVVAFVLVVIGLLVYLKKHKIKATEANQL